MAEGEIIGVLRKPSTGAEGWPSPSVLQLGTRYPQPIIRRWAGLCCGRSNQHHHNRSGAATAGPGLPVRILS